MRAAVEDSKDQLAKTVKLCQAGDQAAQFELYNACYRDVYRLVQRMVGSQLAADISQQVFIQVFTKLDQFQGHSKFKTWVYRIAVNESLQQLRKTSSKNQELEDAVDQRPSVAEQRETRDLLENALTKLEPLLRSIFLLKESHGLSYREIADATGIPEGTVASRLNRARRQLKEHLIQLGWEQ